MVVTGAAGGVGSVAVRAPREGGFAVAASTGRPGSTPSSVDRRLPHRAARGGNPARVLRRRPGRAEGRRGRRRPRDGAAPDRVRRLGGGVRARRRDGPPGRCSPSSSATCRSSAWTPAAPRAPRAGVGARLARPLAGLLDTLTTEIPSPTCGLEREDPRGAQVRGRGSSRSRLDSRFAGREYNAPGDRPSRLWRPPAPPSGPPERPRARSACRAAVPDLPGALDAALAHPVGARPLASVATTSRTRVVVVVSDSSRDEPRAELFAAVRRALGVVLDDHPDDRRGERDARPEAARAARAARGGAAAPPRREPRRPRRRLHGGDGADEPRHPHPREPLRCGSRPHRLHRQGEAALLRGLGRRREGDLPGAGP